MASSTPAIGSAEWNARRARLRRGIGALRSAADLYRECAAAFPDRSDLSTSLVRDAEDADEHAAELARVLTEMEPMDYRNAVVLWSMYGRSEDGSNGS